MGSFFIAFFGILYFLIRFIYEESRGGFGSSSGVDPVRSVSAYRERIMNSKMDYDIEIRIKRDYSYQQQLLKEFNELMSSIPELNGMRMTALTGDKDRVFSKIRILKMIEMSKVGKAASLWHLGEIYSFQFFCTLYDRPTKEGIIAFFKWYEEQMRKNGAPSDFELRAIVNSEGFPTQWFITKATLTTGLRRMW